jgi:hypothetical protein
MTPSSKQPRQWAPRIWEGCDYFAWLKLLTSNRFSVQPPYWYIAGIVSWVTFGNTVLRWIQNSLYGQAIRDVRFDQPPIFVLGHWRTGTTLLHELLILDDRHTSPTTLQCFEPCHFLLSENFFKTYGNILMPDKRPMDNMAAGWDRPQEDEFALALLGLETTYTDFAFPNRPIVDRGALDLSGLTPRQLARWKRTFVQFLQAVTLRDRRRLVLKSPPHTARIPLLLELFPQAKFVHIVRDPRILFASTVKLWMSLGEKHGLRTPALTTDLREKVFREFRIMAERYDQTRSLIPAGHLVEVRYEELVQDLHGGTERIYEGLQLGEFASARPKIEAYIAAQKNYEPNKHNLTPELIAEIEDRWGDIIQRWGY